MGEVNYIISIAMSSAQYDENGLVGVVGSDVMGVRSYRGSHCLRSFVVVSC